MIKRYKIFLLLTFPILHGCIVLHSGSVSSGPLLKRGDQYVDVAHGKSKSVFVFGMGDLSKEDLVEKAKLNLYAARPLKKDEYYANFTTSFTNKYIFLIAHVTLVTVSADILKSEDSTGAVFSETFRKKTIQFEKKAPRSGLKPKEVRELYNGSVILAGDSVYYSDNARDYRLYLVSVVDKETTMLLATNEIDKNRIVPTSHPFFIKHVELGGFRSGNTVSAEILDVYNATTYEDGKVLGVSEGYILVLTKSGFHVLPAVKLKHSNK